MRRGWLLGAALLPIAASLLIAAQPAAATAPIPTTSVVTVSPTSVTYGDSVTYTLTVTASGSTPTGGGETDVNFFAYGTPVCNAALVSGTASCNSTFAPAGVDQVTGDFNGNAVYGPSSATTGTDPNNCGGAGLPTCPLTVNVTPPAAPAGATASASAAGTNHDGSFSATAGKLTVQGNGAGAVTAANYGSNPTSSMPVAATGVYDDVALGSGSGTGLSSLIIAVCDYGAAKSLQWYDAATASWSEFQVQSRNIACLFAAVGKQTSPNFAQLGGTPIAASVISPPNNPQGYWLVARDGGIFSYNRPFFGSTGSIVLNKPIVGMATTNDERGYWMVGADGGIFAFGDAPYVGSLPARNINVSNVVTMVSDPSTDGYYVIGSDGSVWDFNAPQLGDLPFFGFHVNNIVGAALTPSDNGMYLVGADGKVYVLLGDGHFQGDASSLPLNAPIVGMSVDPVTGGYWLLGKDGGVFSYGAPFFGSTGALRLNQPVIAMSPTGDGGGYWFTALDGGVFSYGDAQFWGSTGSIRLNQPVIGMSGS
jgi:hypothetical protein